MAEEPTNNPADTHPTGETDTGWTMPSVDPTEIDRKRGALWIVALTMIAALLYVGWLYVGTFVFSIFVYYVTRPVFRRIRRRIESRTLAVAITLLVAAVPLLLIVGWAIAILASSLADVLDMDLFGGLEAFIQPYLDVAAIIEQVIADPSQLANMELGAILGDVFALLTSWVGIAVNVGIHAFIVLIIVFYLLRDDYRIAAWSRETVIEEGGILETYLQTVDQDLHNVYFGNILNALMTGLLAATVYTLLNFVAPPLVAIPEAAFLGILVGAASLIPVVGIKLVTWPVGGYLLARAIWFDPSVIWFPVLFFAVSFVIVDYIPDQLLRPYVSGRTLHVGAVMLAYTVGPLLFGWYGIFLAPFLFVVVFEFARIIFPWLLDRERGPLPSPLSTDDDVELDPEPTVTVAHSAAESEPELGASDSITDPGPESSE